MVKPRILLVEDDPTTRAFLTAAAQVLPAEVDAVATAAEARALCAGRTYALWLLDAHLPDSDGAGLLTSLHASCGPTPALAHTAARERLILDALLDAGFDEVLVKPISTAKLHAALHRALGGRPAHQAEPGPDLPHPSVSSTWDDAAALRALHGQQQHVDALRELFLAELPGVRDQIIEAVDDGNGPALRAALHRLRASCGFVGAARLAKSVSRLDQSIQPAAALAEFLDVVQDTLSPR